MAAGDDREKKKAAAKVVAKFVKKFLPWIITVAALWLWLKKENADGDDVGRAVEAETGLLGEEIARFIGNVSDITRRARKWIIRIGLADLVLFLAWLLIAIITSSKSYDKAQVVIPVATFILALWIFVTTIPLMVAFSIFERGRKINAGIIGGLGVLVSVGVYLSGAKLDQAPYLVTQIVLAFLALVFLISTKKARKLQKLVVVWTILLAVSAPFGGLLRLWERVVYPSDPSNFPTYVNEAPSPANTRTIDLRRRLRDQNDVLAITLREGDGFMDEYVMRPEQYRIKVTKNAGDFFSHEGTDYAVIWCNNATQPSRVIRTEGELNDALVGCKDQHDPNPDNWEKDLHFWIQGRMTIEFRPPRARVASR